MRIEGNIKLKYQNPEYSEISYKSLEVDNKGFIKSQLKENEVNFKIKSNNLGSFLNTVDDLIASEILIEDVLKKINDN